MDLDISPDLVTLGDSLIKFIDREVAPLEAAHAALLGSERTLYDEQGRYVPRVLALRREIRMRSAALGFYNLLGDASLGGDDMGALAAVYLLERLNEHCGPERVLVHSVVLPSAFTSGLTPVLKHLPPAVFERYGEGIRSGEKTLCFALSEPDAGSDVHGMSTRAVRDGDDWVITGSKQWITNSPYADYAMVFAITNEASFRARKGGITGFFVPVDSPGFSVPRVIPIMGHLGGDTGIVMLDGVRVPDDHRLGPEHQGLTVAMQGVSTGRLGMAGMCVGLARWALRLALDYAKVRKTFGQAIAEHQAVQNLLADCAIDIYAAKCMSRHLATRVDKGFASRKEVSIVKAASTEMLMRVMDRCMQVHGAVGLANDTRLEAGFRAARVLRIPDGTSEIQRRTIAQELLRGDTDL